jgi:hypothetical protein
VSFAVGGDKPEDVPLFLTFDLSFCLFSTCHPPTGDRSVNDRTLSMSLNAEHMRTLDKLGGYSLILKKLADLAS